MSHHPCLNGGNHSPLTATSREISEDEDALPRIRTALRLADYNSAAGLLESIAEQPDQMTAEHFNLLGVLYESRQQWIKAWQCFRQAIAMDPQSEIAKANMHRLLDLRTEGQSTQPAMLGDESEDLWYAQPVR